MIRRELHVIVPIDTDVPARSHMRILHTADWHLGRIFYRTHLTEDQAHTLAPETIDTLEALPEPVTAQAFFSPQSSSGQAREVLEDFEFYGKGKFDYEFIDPDDPQFLTLAQEANVTRDGSVVLHMGDQQETVTFVSEQQITEAMVRLMNPEQRAISFLTGHGERHRRNERASLQPG